VPGAIVYNLGGGSRPCISAEDKVRLNLTVVGVDISADELAAAPPGVYDETTVADLCTFVGRADADIVVCQATLEHVPDTPAAMRGLSTTVKPGGRVLIFAPSRNAMFARMNLVLPEKLKRWLLFKIYPHKAQGHDGFRGALRPLHSEPDRGPGLREWSHRRRAAIILDEFLLHFFHARVPLWRLSQLVAYALLRNNAAESFVYVLRRSSEPVL
jgi:SAM-dependent methyltransferase